MAEADAPSKAGIEIPYFFYDIIARIAPGAFLIVGVAVTWKCAAFSDALTRSIKEIMTSELTGGAATLLIGTGLLVFVSVSAFLGFLLASISNVFVEQWIFHRWPPSIKGLVEFLGVKDDESLKKEFREQFGTELKDESLNKASFLCAYYVWNTAPALGAMVGRFDAELLAAQSLVLVTLTLIVSVTVRIYASGWSLYLGIWLGILTIILLGSFLTFKYHRKKRVYGRYMLFLVLQRPGRKNPPTS